MTNQNHINYQTMGFSPVFLFLENERDELIIDCALVDEFREFLENAGIL